MKNNRMIDHVKILLKIIGGVALFAVWLFLVILLLSSSGCGASEPRVNHDLERQRQEERHQARCRDLHESMDIEDLRGYCNDQNIPGRRRQYICETVQEYDRECPSNATAPQAATNQQ